MPSVATPPFNPPKEAAFAAHQSRGDRRQPHGSLLTRRWDQPFESGSLQQ
jgi:hypothetical protein